MEVIKELKKMRTRFRREATRCRKMAAGDVAAGVLVRLLAEANVYNLCANEVSRLIENIEEDAKD